MRVMLGVDIGGTKIALGCVASDGSLPVPTARVASDTRGQEEFVGGLVDAVRDAVERGRRDGLDVFGVGLGCAGTVDRARGAVVVSPNLPLVDVPLAGLVSARVGLPTVLENDANGAALAEARVGAAAGLRHVAMLTLGTGVGGGLILDGRVYRGATGAAGELGHIIVAAGGERCSCGAFGCLEAYASGKALERTASRLVDDGGSLPRATGARAAGASGWAATPDVAFGGAGPVSVTALAELRDAGRLDGESIGRLALVGDAGALAAVTEVGAWLGVGIVSIANMFEPEAVVVGGGLGSLGELLLAPARRVVLAGALAPNRNARLLAASVGEEAGVVGAGLLAWEELGA